MSYEVTLAISIAQAFRAHCSAMHHVFYVLQDNCLIEIRKGLRPLVWTAARRPSAFNPETPFARFAPKNEHHLLLLSVLFNLPGCGLPTGVGDALIHVVLNLENLFVMKFATRTIGRSGKVPADEKKVIFFIRRQT